MPVVRIRKVRMPMFHRFVSVPMAMFSARRQRLGVSVLVMLVVHVFVLVLEHLVKVFVLVSLGQMQPHTERH